MISKKGSAALVYIMLGIVFFLLGMALAPALTGTSNESREEMHCSWTNITNQDKAVCTQLDVISPFYIAILFGLSGIILSRVVM